MSTDENKLVARLKNGDAQAMRPMMLLYKDYVFTLALRIVKKKELAEEVTQDVFVKVFKKIKTFDGRSMFKSWLYTVTFRVGLNYLDKKEMKAADRIVYPQEINDLPGIDFSDETLLEHEKQDVLWKAIDRLPRMQALSVTLFYLQELSITEISDVLSIPANTVKTHLFRGRKMLYQRLIDKIKLEEII